jgi:hypothetical protein
MAVTPPTESVCAKPCLRFAERAVVHPAAARGPRPESGSDFFLKE